MDDLDSLLQDLERATTNLKNNPGNLGAWKLNKPSDPTLTSAYSTAKVAKHYSPQYYVNDDEPLYQNETIRRSQSIASSTTHDYAAINGNGTSSPQPSTPMQYQGTTTKPKNYQPVNSKDFTDANDTLSANLSLLDSLLDDLNDARKMFDQKSVASPTSPFPSSSSSPLSMATTMPRLSNNSSSSYSPHHNSQSASNATFSSLNRSMRSSPVHSAAVASDYLDTQLPIKPVNGVTNGHLANGDSNGMASQQRQQQPHRSDSVQVNDLIKDLEYSLHSTDSTYAHVNKPTKSVTINTNGMQSSTSVRPSPPRSAQIQPVSEYNRNLVSIQPQHARLDSNAVIQVPLPHGTSNATRELDDLMASLSDFKLNQMKNGQTPSTKNANYVPIGKIQVPSKNPQLEPLRPSDKLHLAGDLDSMIGNLESDLNRHGVNIATKGTCEKCKRAIVGQVVAAMGKTWHPEHFTCVQCGTELGDSTFFERDGLAFCERDYHKLYSPQCGYCNKPILDRCITALDKTWHPEHFSCAHCGKNFGDDGYHEKAGSAYCREDFFKLFAPKCAGCSNPIEDNYVTALGAQWHSQCFVCRDCNTPFNNGNFFDFEGRPYCEPHYHDKRGTLCVTCRQPIEGRCITAMSQKYHPEHFTCSFCLKQLNKGTFKKHSEKPYCHSCFDKLFA